MSLILEALRRSEAERQRGKAPGLFVEQQPLSRRRRGRVPAPALAGAAVLLVAIGAGWTWREFARGEAAEVAATPPPVAATAPVPTPAPAPTPAPGPGPSLAPAAVSSSPPVAATAAAPPTGTAPRADAPVVTLPDAVPEPVATVDTAAVAPPVIPAAPGNEPALPGLAALPAAERASLPPLKLSMHVYSDEPARRFVIVDGQRLVEGATPAPGIVVESIRRDGAVLAVNGRRVLLGRP